jgi:hypothetical protein
MMFPLVLDLAADPIHKIPVAVTCLVLGFSRQAFYQWRAQPVSQRDLGRRAPDQRRGRHPPRRTDELARGGLVVSRNRVNRLCTQQRLWSVHARKRGLSRRPGPPVHDDLVRREFTAAAPNRLWLTDITEHPTAWIPAVVATPDGGVGDGRSEVHASAEGDVLLADRSWWDGAGGGEGGRCP